MPESLYIYFTVLYFAVMSFERENLSWLKNTRNGISLTYSLWKLMLCVCVLCSPKIDSNKPKRGRGVIKNKPKLTWLCDMCTATHEFPGYKDKWPTCSCGPSSCLSASLSFHSTLSPSPLLHSPLPVSPPVSLFLKWR